MVSPINPDRGAECNRTVTTEPPRRPLGGLKELTRSNDPPPPGGRPRREPPDAVVFLYGGALRAPLQRSHHLAREFARYLPVVYVPYRSPVEALQGNLRTPPWAPLVRHPAVRHVPMPPTTFLARRSRGAARAHAAWIARQVKGRLRQLGVAEERALLFVELATAADVLAYFPASPVMYDCVDDFRHWHDDPPARGTLYAAMEEEVGMRADWLVVALPRLLPRFAHWHARRIEGLNGIDPAPFLLQAAGGEPDEPDDLRGIPRPRLMYVGVVSSYVDAELIRSLARSCSGSVVLIGPVDPRAPVARLRGHPNVHFLGRKPYEALPRYLAAADVGLIPGTPTAASDCVPSKLFMYCAAGLPVVARHSASLEPFRNAIRLAEDPRAFLGEVRAAATCADPDRESRRQLGLSHTWQSLAERLLKEAGVGCGGEQ